MGDRRSGEGGGLVGGLVVLQSCRSSMDHSVEVGAEHRPKADWSETRPRPTQEQWNVILPGFLLASTL